MAKILADFFGLPFPRHELAEKKGMLTIAADIELDLVHVTAAPPSATTVGRIEREFDWFLNILSRQGKKVVVVKKISDLDQPGLKVLCGLQHPPLDATLRDMQRLREMGIVVTAIAYQKENAFGGGFLVPGAGLTFKGKTFITAAAVSGMIIDLSHAGHKTAGEVLEFVDKTSLRANIVATHTGCWSVYQHLRNLADDVLLQIAQRGGIVGIATLTFILDGQDDSLASFKKHLDHAIRLVGSKHVCLGTDAIYAQRSPKRMRECFEMMKKEIDDPDGLSGARFPEQPLELNTPRLMEQLETRVGMVAPRGTVEGIMGLNLMNYLRRVLP